MQERPEQEKLSHEEVGYERYSTHGREEDCLHCSMFVQALPPRCTLVKEPIYVAGWCRKWEAKKGKR